MTTLSLSPLVGGTSVGTAAAGTDVLTTRVTGDSYDRFVLNGDGRLDWGPGTGALDSALYRVDVAFLGTNSSILCTRWIQAGSDLTAGNYAFVAAVKNDTGFRLMLLNNGEIVFGDGTDYAGDVKLYRSSANVLKTDDVFYAVSTIQSDVDVYARHGTTRVMMGTVAGSYAGITFGVSGGADTDLYRTAAGKLGTSGQLIAGDGLTTKPVAGAVSDGSFSVTPASGTIAVDTTNSKIYVRVGSTWKSVSVT